MNSSKKASIELSMNFMIMLILAITVFGLGMFFLFKVIMPEVSSVSDTLNEQTRKDIERTLLASGKPVAFPKNSVTVKKDDYGQLGIGISNNHENKEYFELEIDCIKAYTIRDQTRICDNTAGMDCSSKCGDNWIINRDEVFKIPKKEQDIKGLFIHVPAGTESGKYYFKVTVNAMASSAGTDTAPHDTPKKFHIIVE